MELQKRAVTREQNKIEQAMTERKSIRLRQLRDCCKTLFWKYYCNLPTAYTTRVAVRKLTSTFLDDQGRFTPIHPAPQLWVDEVFQSIQDLVAVDGKKLA